MGSAIRSKESIEKIRTYSSFFSLKQGELLVAQGEGVAMMGSDAVLLNSGIVLTRGVAHVVFPAILWVIASNGAHVVVAIGFCQN